jgi:hypothetical protein
MSDTKWTAIPGRLKAAGFDVFFDRISYEPKHPLWCAKASRGGRQWSTLGKDLCSAFRELERQALDTAGDWREAMAAEVARKSVADTPQPN